MMPLQITPYEIGEYYSVPVVRGEWMAWYDEFPVLGPKHEDAKIIGFKHQHYHLDFRFLDEVFAHQVKEWSGGELIHEVFTAPLHGPTEKSSHKPETQYLGVRRLKCQRHWPEYPRIPRWLKKLEKAYANESIGPGLVCPHKGAPLQGLEVKEGKVVCPLHGLRWSVETGKLIRELPGVPHV